MGTFIGHIAPGAGFLLVGLWHLYNTIANYLLFPWDFHSRPWFPVKKLQNKLKYLELYAIIFGSALSIASELFIGPRQHQPWAEDWSIPPQHLNNFEHSSISLFFFLYAMVALIMDLYQIAAPFGLLHLLGAFAFSQELLLFHFHSTDHMGLEGQYHWLLQLAIFVSLSCTLLEIVASRSFVVALVRAMSIFFQGLWFIHMGFILWFPWLTPKGCAMTHEENHVIVRCPEGGARMRAKALANLQFSWYVAGVIVFTLLLYTWMLRLARRNVNYMPLGVEKGAMEEAKDVEAGRLSPGQRSFDGSQGSIEMEALQALNLER